MNAQVVLIGAAIGVLATLIMDIGSILDLRKGIAVTGLRRMGRRMGWGLIGRWFGYLLRGKFRHTDILRTPPIPREVPLGLLVHYLIGIVLALAYIGILVVTQTPSTLLTAVVFGLATTVFPWFYLYPVWGYGWLGREPSGNYHKTRMSLYSHLVFGLGLALWMAVLKPL
jgi:Protein of unknown function (DUF2938)